MKSFLASILGLASFFTLHGSQQVAPATTTVTFPSAQHVWTANSIPVKLVSVSRETNILQPKKASAPFVAAPAQGQVLGTSTSKVVRYITEDELTAALQQIRFLLAASAMPPTAAVPPNIAGNGLGVFYGATPAPVNVINSSAVRIVLSASDIPDLSAQYLPVSAIVSIAHGGTGTSTAPTYGKVLLGNTSGSYDLVATSSLGIGASANAGGVSGQVQYNDSGVLAGSSAFTFNSTSGALTVTNFIVTNATTTSATTTNLSTTNASTTNLTISSLGPSAGQCLTVNSSGTLTTTTCAGSSFAYPFSSNATTTQLAFSGGATFAGATSTALAVTGSSTIQTLNLTNALTVANGGTGSTTLGGILTGNGTGAVTSAVVSSPLSFSGTTLSIQQATAAQNGYLSSTDWSTFNNKISSTSLSSANGYLTYNSSTGVFTASTSPTYTTATSTTFATTNITIGLLSGLLKATSGAVAAAVAGTDYLAPSGLSTTYPVQYNSGTGVFSLAFGTSTSNTWGGTQTFTNTPVLGALSGLVGSNNGMLYQIATSSNFVTSLAAGSGITLSGATGAVTVTNAIGYPFPSNATTTSIAFNGGLTATGATLSSTTLTGNFVFANATGTNATSTSFAITNISSGNLLKTTTGGAIVAATAGTDYLTSSSGITSVAAGGVTTTGGAVTLATSTLAFNGLTLGQTIINSSGTFTFTPTVSGTLNNAGLTNSTISGIALGSNLANLSATDSTLTFSGSYNGGTARTVGLNLGNANAWTALQQFNNASTSLFSAYGSAYFGATATSSFGANGALTLATALAVGSGGTGWANINAGYIPFGNGASALSTSTNLFWDNTNSRLGIGTTSPSGTLAVSGSSGNSLKQLVLQNTSSGGEQIELEKSSGAPGTMLLWDNNNANAWLYSGASANLLFGTGGQNERMRIDTSGNVGIGTTSPWARTSIDTSSLASGVPSFVVGSSTRTDFVINQAGNVGIGPSLTLYNSNTASPYQGSWYEWDNTWQPAADQQWHSYNSWTYPSVGLTARSGKTPTQLWATSQNLFAISATSNANNANSHMILQELTATIPAGVGDGGGGNVDANGVPQNANYQEAGLIAGNSRCLSAGHFCEGLEIWSQDNDGSSVGTSSRLLAGMFVVSKKAAANNYLAEGVNAYADPAGQTTTYAPDNAFSVSGTWKYGLNIRDVPTTADIVMKAGSNHTILFDSASSLVYTSAAQKWGFVGGSVGIGTTTPRGTFDIPTGSLLVGTGLTNNPRFELFDSNSGGAGYGRLQTYNGDLALNPLGNNVGIGTTSPQGKLQISGTNAAAYFDIGNTSIIGQLAQTSHLANNVGSVGLAINDGGGNSGVFVNNRFSSPYSSQDITFLSAHGGVSAATERMRIDKDGNVGIGTTTPWRKLSVTGTVGFDGLTGSTGAGSLCLSANKEVVYNSGSDSCLSSTRATKHDITALDLSALDMVTLLQPVSFIYNNDASSTVRYGFIAEDTATVDSHLATYDAQGAISGIDDRAILSVLVKAVQDVIATLGRIEATIAGFASTFTTKQLCVEKSDGTPVCITGDQLANILGGTPTVEISAPAGPMISTTTPPSISIQGNNPATIHVGDSYIDLGAIVTDNQGHELSYRLFVNGQATDTINIDTTAEATTTIDYVATDTWGNTSTSTRTVVIDPAVTTVNSSDAPPIAPDAAGTTEAMSTEASTTVSN